MGSLRPAEASSMLATWRICGLFSVLSLMSWVCVMFCGMSRQSSLPRLYCSRRWESSHHEISYERILLVSPCSCRLFRILFSNQKGKEAFHESGAISSALRTSSTMPIYDWGYRLVKDSNSPTPLWVPYSLSGELNSDVRETTHLVSWKPRWH